MKYDVFISCRSYDYAMAEEICKFLKEKGLKVFFSNRSIDQEGHSLYEKVIANAIRDSANMIVVCSNANYVKFDEDQASRDQGSRWVYYEWSTFHQMILDKEKPLGADIVTVYTPAVNKKDLPHRLRNRQCIPYSEYKNRILRYVDDSIREQNDNVANADSEPEPIAVHLSEQSGEDKSEKWKRLRMPLLTGLVGLLLGLGMYGIGYHQAQKKADSLVSPDTLNTEKTLVLAGGGSVVTFLDEKYRGKYCPDSVRLFGDNRYPNAFYLHIPSSVALTLLAEEAIMPYSRINQPFYPVCFSAEKADEGVFLTKCSAAQMKDAGYIAEYKLGDEELAVYVENDARLNAVIDSTAKEITVKQLVKLLHLNGFSIFSTSDQSGTYHAYYEALKSEKCDLSSIIFGQFSSQTPLEMLQSPNKERKPFIVMGGDLYRPEELKDPLENKTVRKLALVNNGQPVTRPLYIYFLAYRKDINGKKKYIVPAEVRKLLDTLGFENKKELINKNNELTVLNTDKIIVPIE